MGFGQGWKMASKKPIGFQVLKNIKASKVQNLGF